MKNSMKKNKLFGMVILIVGIMLAFAFTGCDDGSTGGGAPSATYKGTDRDDNTWTLTITQTVRTITPSEGDGYVLTVGTRRSTGTVDYVGTGGKLTLQPNRAGAGTFTAEVSDNGLTDVSGLITFDTGDPEYGPGELTPVAPPPSGSGTYAVVSAGGVHTVGIQTNGSLWVWGNNSIGQLGDGTYGSSASKSSPVRIGSDTNWKSVAASFDCTLGIKTNGSLWAWGNNGYGQFGNGTTTDSYSPVRIGSDTWASVSAGAAGRYTVGIKTDGSLWAWGGNEFGQLGNGTVGGSGAYNPSPVRIGSDTWKSVSAGSNYTVSIKTDGSLWAWGSGPLGDGDPTPANKPAPVRIGSDTNWKSVSAGSNHTVGIKTDGSLWSWGQNTSGQLGDGTSGSGTNKYSPVRIGLDTWASVSAGGDHTVGIKTDGSLWAWGNNGQGQLGDGTYGSSASKSSPVRIGSDTWASVFTGSNNTVGIQTNGSLWAWGNNQSGKLGDGTNIYKASPVKISP